MPGSRGLGQRASLWSGTAASWIDLNPTGSTLSNLNAVDVGQQVGSVRISNIDRASLWTGTAASWVSLNPAEASSSSALGVSGGQQVGFAFIGTSHAGFWTGTAASWVDLHPAGATSSKANGVNGGQQVGIAVVGGRNHASIWSGTAASWVDLHTFLPVRFKESFAYGIEHVVGTTYVVGWGHDDALVRDEAIMWVAAAAPVCCSGDFNADNVVTNADIPDFVTALLVSGPCPAPPACCPGDFNADGMVDGTDIPGFLARLFSGGACP